MARLELKQLKGQVHRFTGYIDRFGSYPTGEKRVLTVCIRDLQLGSSGKEVHPDHWWFPLRQEFAELNLQPGDKVAFTAKIQRCHKGFHSLGSQEENAKPPRIAFGPGCKVKNLTLLKRRAPKPSLTEGVKQIRSRLVDQEQDKMRLMQVVDVLDRQVKNLGEQLTTQQQECHAKDGQINAREQELFGLKRERHQLVSTVACLERQVQSSIPRQWAFPGFAANSLLCLAIGMFL